MAAIPSANEWTNHMADAAPYSTEIKPRKCITRDVMDNVDIFAYGPVIEVLNYQPLADSTDDTCILIQEAGRPAYDDSKLGTKENIAAFAKLAKENIAAFAKLAYPNRVHIFNFDAGDEKDAEAPVVREIWRQWWDGLPLPENEPAGEGHVLRSEVEAVNGVLLKPGETPEDAIRDAFRDSTCYMADLRAPLKHAYSGRLKLVSDIERHAAQIANVKYTWTPVWDYNMPTQSEVNAFVREYSRQPPGTTNVFHCGAGIGRSGLFVLAARVADIRKRGEQPPKTWVELDALLRNTYTRSSQEIRHCNYRKIKALFEMLEVCAASREGHFAIGWPGFP